jgi:hypothetical protein
MEKITFAVHFGVCRVLYFGRTAKSFAMRLLYGARQRKTYCKLDICRAFFATHSKHNSLQ